MPRVFSYDEIKRGTLAPVEDILDLAGQIAELPSLGAGHAIVAGSAAWGAVSIRSDIDIIAYKSFSSTAMEVETQMLRERYARMSGRAAPLIDITWVGAESEKMIERDNLVSKSAPILEHHVVREIFERTCIRLIDHLRALAEVKGEPWRSFLKRHLRGVKPDPSIRRDVLREYANGMIQRWRQQAWGSRAGAPLSKKQLDLLGNMEGFGYHLLRLILADMRAYPKPDRHSDLRKALSALRRKGSDELQHVVAPLLGIGERYESLLDDLARESRSGDERRFNTGLREAAAKVNVDAIEEFVWKYLKTP